MSRGVCAEGVWQNGGVRDQGDGLVDEDSGPKDMKILDNGKKEDGGTNKFGALRHAK